MRWGLLASDRASHVKEDVRPCKYHAKEKKRWKDWLNIFKRLFQATNSEPSYARHALIAPFRGLGVYNFR